MKKFILSVCLGALLLLTPAWAQQPKGTSPCAPNSLTVTGTTGNVQLSTCGATLIVMNITSQEAFYKIGPASTQAATTTVTDSYSIPGNSFELLTVPGLAGAGSGWYFAAITATGSTTLRLIQGND
jgi:hypothetical protein